MLLSNLSIKRPVFAAVLMLALVTLGAFSYRRLAIDMFPDIENEAAANILAGLIGTLLIFGIVYGLAWLIKPRKKETTQDTKSILRDAS